MRKMNINIFGKKGQNTAEYAIVIALVVAAAIAMQTYVKRGMQGRVYDASNKFFDNLTDNSKWTNLSATTVTAKKQYEPEKLESKSTQQTLEDYEELNMTTGGKTSREFKQRTNQSAGDYQKYGY